MPHETMKFVPGVDQNKTPVLNQAAVSFCNLVRQMVDRSGFGLWQKLGGWLRFFPTAMPAIPRALWAWSDTNDNQWLAVGCEAGPTVADGSSLQVINNGNARDITLRGDAFSATPSLDTTIGDNRVEIDLIGSGVTNFDTVYIPTHISVGGQIVFGLYQCYPISNDAFDIYLTDKAGNPALAVTTVVNGGAVATFTTVVGSSIVTVFLTAHNFRPGDIFPVLMPFTVVGGIVLAGDYIIQDVGDANHFTILTPTAATIAGGTTPINGGQARYEFYRGAAPPAAGSGYGVGGYGIGGYGAGTVPVAHLGNPIDTNDWTLDNWGDFLIICPVETTFGSSGSTARHGGPLFFWSPLSRPPTPRVIANGPPLNDGAFIAMPQRQIVAWGSSFGGIQDHLLVRWCDIDDFNTWIGNPSNRAGSRRLSRGSRIVSGIQLGLQGLLVTDVGAWSMQFIDGQGVYSIQEISRNCGCIGRKALGTLGQSAYWMGTSQFFSMGNDGVAPMICPVWDRVFKNIYPGSEWKIRFGANSLYNEIIWYYAAADGNGEIDSYVKNNLLLPPGQGWDYGALSRTAWIDRSVLGGPIGAGGDTRLIYTHESGHDADDQPMVSFIRTGYFALTEGDFLMFVDQVWPDMKWGDGTSTNATVYITFFVKSDYPSQPDEVYGPFTLTSAVDFITPRFRGRLVALELRSDDTGTFWRVGGNRYRSQPDGKFY